MSPPTQEVMHLVKGVGGCFTYGSRYRDARFGGWGKLFYWTWFLDTDLVQELHWNINRWTDKEATAWKTSCQSSCNAVSVAAAIFASVGLTGLQLPEIDNVHWTSRALLVSSMAIGVLSLIIATAVHKEVTNCTSAFDIRLWLSRGVTRNKYRSPYDSMPLESSSVTVKFLEAPSTLLYTAAVLYLVGVALYYLFQFVDARVFPPQDNRNIFIFVMLVVGAATAYLLLMSLVRKADRGHRSERLKLTDLWLVGEKSPEVRTLEIYFKHIHAFRSSGDEEEELKAKEAACAIMKHQEALYMSEKAKKVKHGQSFPVDEESFNGYAQKVQV